MPTDYEVRKQYSKNRLKQLKDPDLLKLMPYWKYVCNKTMQAPCHLQWDGLVLHHSDPWWKKHFPPKDKHCRCRVAAAFDTEYTGQIAPMDY